MLHAKTGTSLKTFVPVITTRRWLIISRRLLPMLLGLCACLGLAKPAGAVVRYVDSGAPPGGDGLSWGTAYDSLSTALTAAQPGDQIWVVAGTYVGNFTLALGVEVYGGFDGTETGLTQRDWTANPTILDGNSTGSVVTSPAGATAATRIDGFTITNGSAQYGGGLYLWYSSPTIANNTITGNKAHENGGGLYLDWDSSPTIVNNTVTANDASYGGGLHLDSSSPTIANNTVSGNSASLFGGGLCLRSSSSPTIANNTITGNSASNGGGLYLEDSSPTIANNTITGNSADYSGGLFLLESSPTIANTIVAFNSLGIYADTGTPTLRYNCVYGNTSYDYYGLDDPTGTAGNISADPRLADPRYGNTHIQPDSPCADAGSNADASGDSDLDGEPRIQGGTVDIGADESDGTVWPAGPYVIVRVSPAGDDANDGSSWALAKRTVQAGIYAAFALGGEVWVQGGTYYECVTLPPYVCLYGGFAGGETVRDERDWDANVTTLDGQRQGSVVTARGGYRVNAIDGFTITNGNAEYGGGLYLRYSTRTIENNTITGNSASQDGGGLHLYYSSPTIANNTITGNGAHDGGGLYLRYSTPTIENNTITGNSASHDGGGLHLYYSSPTIANTIVAFNSSGIHRYDTASTPTLRYNCVYGNTEYDYSGLDDPTGTDGNISADPRLASPQYGNAHIQPDSPCVDTGSNADTSGDFDVDGEPRIQGGTVEIGADESDGTVWAAGPYVIVRVSPAGDDANDGSSWALAKRTVQAAIDAAFALGGEVWVQGGTYYECVTLPPYVCLYGGFAGGETVRDERDWDANVTTLDGRRRGSVVTARGGYRVNAIDGFTITNGSGTALNPYNSYGGGMYLESCSPTIANNTITGNEARYGGGLYLDSSSPTIANNTITGNEARYGGGLCLRYSSPTIENNTITGNSAGYEGGGLYLRDSTPAIANNTITANSADYGAGLHLLTSSPTIANNTITGNGAAEGGGLFLRGSSPTIGNTIVAFNSSGIFRDSGTPTLRHNCVFGNTAYDYDGLTDPTGTDGNIAADPLFVQNPDPGPDGLWGTEDDDFGDLQLASGSPCIDAGDNDGVPPDTPDLDGDSDTEEPLPLDLAGGPRFLDDPQTPDTGNGVPPIVDMGAYEFHRPIVIAAHLDIKPGSCPNPVNLGSRGVVPVAIVGSESFDVTELIFDSLALGRADGVGGVVPPLTKRDRPWGAIEDVAMPYLGDLCDCQEGGADGIEDYALKFSTREMVRVLELDTIPRRTPVALTLTGSLVDGTMFEAFDCIVTTGQPTQILHGSRLGKQRDHP